MADGDILRALFALIILLTILLYYIVPVLSYFVFRDVLESDKKSKKQ